MEISVVMPVYNCRNYIDEAIGSVLLQTFRDFEFIIIDDGSTDDTVLRIRKHTDPRIRLICNKHDFIGSLNKGLSEARGKYIARMDSDDLMHPDRLSIQYETMEAHPDIAVCASWIKLFGKTEKEVHSFSGYITYPLVSLLTGNIIAHPTVMLRNSFLQKHGLHYEAYPHAEDYKLWTRIAECGGRFWVEPACLLNYRISDEQVSCLHHQQQSETTFLIRNEVLDYLLTHVSCEREAIGNLAGIIYELNEKELLSEELCFRLFYDLFLNLAQQKKDFVNTEA